MKRVSGFRLLHDIAQQLRENGFMDGDLQQLKKEAEEMMFVLEKQFTEKGIERKWKLSDMVVDIDLNTKKIQSMVPTDWERTKIKSQAR
jgi:hypothetical protein